MILSRAQRSFLLLGSFAMAAFAAPLAQAQNYVSAGEYVAAGTLSTTGSRCADFGPDFIEMGNGICGRVGSAARVQLGTRSVNANALTSGGTTSATLRSDGTLPGASVQHLRVRNGLESYTPFQ